MSPSEPRFPVLSRRGFLLASAGLAVAAACGGDDTATVEGEGDGDARSETSLVQFFASEMLAAGGGQRLPVGLADAEGAFIRETPDEVRFHVSRDGREVTDPTPVARHAEGLERPYYPVRVDLEDPGLYVLVAELEDGRAEASFEVHPKSKVKPPGVGDRLVSVATPTTADARGVDPICTREPACELHGMSLDEALKQGRPVAFAIATPAYCQIGVCGPVVDVLQSFRGEYGDRVEMIHAEVYTDRTIKTTAPVVQAYQLPTEPVLWLAGADGVVTARLDNIYDTTELGAALDELVS